MRDIYHKFGQNIKIFKILCTKYMASSEVMTSSTHSFAYSYRLVKKCFVKICETSKCHNFLFFNRFSSGFHCYVWIFLLFLLKFKLYLFRISPLSVHGLIKEIIYSSGTLKMDGDCWEIGHVTCMSTLKVTAVTLGDQYQTMHHTFAGYLTNKILVKIRPRDFTERC